MLDLHTMRNDAAGVNGPRDTIADADLDARRLMALFAATEDAVVTTAADGTITSWNRGAELLFGYPAPEAIGSPMAMLVPPDRAGEEQLVIARVLAGEAVEQLETRRLDKALRARDVALTAAPVRDAGGKIVEVATVARDITDGKRAERELDRYVSDLEALALRDPRTGLLTRRELHGVLERELARAARDGVPCSVLVAAFDAPPVEPTALRALADVIRITCGPGELGCCLNEAELAVVLPGATAGAAMALARRLQVAWTETGGPGTVVTGVAAFPDEAADKDGLLRCADAALRFEQRADEAAAPVQAEPTGGATLRRVLALLRRHLGMEIAYVTEFVGDTQIVRETDVELTGEHPQITVRTIVPLGGGFCRRMVEGELGNVVPDTAADPVAAALPATTEASIGSYVGVPVRLSDGRLYGTLCSASRDPQRHLDASAVHFVRVCARLVADVVEQRELEAVNQRLQTEVTGVRALLAALDARDRYTGEHSQAVVAVARAVGRRLELDEADLVAVEQVALLHDIGKIGVPDAILQKPGPLTSEDWLVMSEHPAIGARIIGSIPSLGHLAPAIRAEHERWDGDGYPDRLAGEAIPLASRIVLACDAFHAMTSDRPYRTALARTEAAAELSAGAGSQFDPAVVEALLAHLQATEALEPPAADRPVRVLVVEDDDGLRVALEHGLAAEGFTVDAVASAPEAYGRLADCAPDLVLLDWFLREGDMGAAACRRLRELDPQAAVVMFTGMDDVRDRRAAMDAGAAAYLRKGMPLSELAHQLRRVLDARK